MTRSQKLKTRLKAADRRRRRRLSAASSPVDNSRGGADGSPDVAGILTAAALDVAETSPRLNDRAVVGALRAMSDGTTPTSPFTRSVFFAMSERLDRAGISAAEGRRGAADLLAISLPNLHPDVPDQLLKYLSLIAS